MSLLLRNARLVLDPVRGVVLGWLLLEEGLIARIGLADEAPPEGIPSIDCGGDFVAPGLIDLHLHGAAGRDAMEASEVDREEAFGAILAAHARHGTTTALLTTVAASLPDMLAVLDVASAWHHAEGCARLEGIHLEGPWFSPKRRGAHDPAQLRHPTGSEVDELLDHASMIRRVTLAPELPGALETIRALVRSGITVSAGHSDATEKAARAGFDAGITQVTHLHNAMSSLRKTDPARRGLAEAALETPDILCELIADGVHVSGELLREALEAKGWEGIALVSDATAGAGLPVGSLFSLGSLTCRVESDAARTEVGEGAGEGCLAGSTRFLFDGIRTMVEQGGATLAEAVAMATRVPAASLGLENTVGMLKAGCRADLIRFSQDWQLVGVLIGGEGVSLS
jgi:N-acetylglucosamine-6-phosphate deacetylase